MTSHHKISPHLGSVIDVVWSCEFSDICGIFGSRVPDAITTDALSGFEQGFNSTMANRNGTKILHRKDAAINKRHANNNTYERLNGTMRRRFKCVNGFQDMLPALHVLFLAYYNLIRPHSGVGGKTPAEAIGVVLNGTDKWLTAIRHAAPFCT